MGRRHRSLEARLQRAWRSTTIYASSPFAASCGPFDDFQPFNKIFSDTADVYIVEQMQQQQQEQWFECFSPNHGMQQQQTQQQHVQKVLSFLSTPSQGAGESIINILQVCESDFTTKLAKEESEESSAASEHEKISQENEVAKSSAPETHWKSQGAGESFSNVLQVCESDFINKLAKEVSDESSAPLEHEKISQEYQVTMTTDKQDVNYKTQEFKSQDETAADFSADRETTHIDLSAVLEDYAKIKDRCIATLKTYSERKGRSEAEIKGPKDALSILEVDFKKFYEQFEKCFKFEAEEAAAAVTASAAEAEAASHASAAAAAEADFAAEPSAAHNFMGMEQLLRQQLWLPERDLLSLARCSRWCCKWAYQMLDDDHATSSPKDESQEEQEEEEFYSEEFPRCSECRRLVWKPYVCKGKFLCGHC